MCIIKTVQSVHLGYPYIFLTNLRDLCIIESGEILYCGFGLGAEVSNKEDVNEFACLRHLHTLSVDEVEGARIEAGLHFLALTTQRGI